jgi:hypothetical protein
MIIKFSTASPGMLFNSCAITIIIIGLSATILSLGTTTSGMCIICWHETVSVIVMRYTAYNYILMMTDKYRQCLWFQFIDEKLSCQSRNQINSTPAIMLHRFGQFWIRYENKDSHNFNPCFIALCAQDDFVCILKWKAITFSMPVL